MMIFVKIFEFPSRDQIPLKIGKSFDCHKLGVRLERYCPAKRMSKSLYPIVLLYIDALVRLSLEIFITRPIPTTS
jgi:hypothetical protein